MKPSRFVVVLAILTLALPSSLLFGQQFPQAYPQQGFPQPAAQDLPYDAQGQPAQLLPQQELENLVAPIALYPDALLSQILVAATYPLEVVEVGQWLQQNRNRPGQDLIAAASQQNWDASIQALVAFPDVVSRMNSDIRWVTDLGNAFLAQQGDVMNAIQVLRAQAQANGRLASNQQQIVTVEAQGPQSVIEIQPADPQVVYVPTYDPEYVWGPPSYGYYPSLYYPEFGFSFGYGIPIGGYFGGLGWNSWGWGPNWFGGGIVVNSYFFDRYHFNSYRGGRYGGGYGGGYRGGNNWSHNPDHRRGVAYSNNRVADSFRGTTRGDNRFGGGGFNRSTGGYNGGTSRGFNGSTGGQAGGQRFSTQRDSSFRGSNPARGSTQFNADRSQVAPSQSQMAPAQGSRFGNRDQGNTLNQRGNRGAQSFQAPAQSRPSFSGNAGNGGFQSAPSPQTYQAPVQSRPSPSFNGGGGFRSNQRSAPSPQTYQAPVQSRPSPSFNSGGFRSNQRSAPSPQTYQAPAQSRPSPSFNGGGFRSNQRSAPSPQTYQAPAQSRPSQSFNGGGGGYRSSPRAQSFQAPAQSRPSPSGGGAFRGNGGGNGGFRGNGGGNGGGNGSRSRR